MLVGWCWEGKTKTKTRPFNFIILNDDAQPRPASAPRTAHFRFHRPAMHAFSRRLEGSLSNEPRGNNS